jgi:ABC-type transport system involved in multi-copper enzyme maturation permease subunit
MIFLIARKEFLNNLLTARFIIGFLLCLVLIPFSILLSVSDYRDQSALYRQDRDAVDKATKEVYVYSGLRPTVVLPPEPLSVFSRGIRSQVGNRVKIYLGEKPLLTEGKAAVRDNPFLASFFSVDFVDIAAIIFSLLALLFSYDAFSREKESGTLKLQMSNSLGRSAVLAGKVLGILLTLLPILIFCFLLSAVLVLISGNAAFTGLQWGRVALLFGASLIYLAVFVFIGLFISARSRTSVTSLVVCLFIWVFFVFIVPNLSAYAAESFVAVPSRENLTRVLADLDKERDGVLNDRRKALPEVDWDIYWWMSGRDDGYMETYGCTKSKFEQERQVSMIQGPLLIDYADKKWAAQKSYLDGLVHQSRVAEGIAMISPSGVFRLIASAICSTDVQSHEGDLDRARQYRETFIRYFQGKNIFASFRYITPTPPEAMLTGDQLVEKRSGGRFKTVREYDDWAGKEKDFRARWQALQKVKVRFDNPDDFSFLDISDMPKYSDRADSLLTGLSGVIPRIGLLLIEIILLFYLGYVAFIRYDVR